MLKFLCYFIALLVSLSYGISAFPSEQCRAPDGKSGICVLLEDCPSINKMSNDFETPMTLERLHFLTNSMCKYQNRILTVCCTLQEIRGDLENNTI